MREYTRRTAEFYNEHAKEFEEQTSTLQDRDWLEKLCHDLQKHAAILDVGCGFGRDAAYFVSQGFETYGIDISEELISRAKHVAPQARFKVGDVLSLPYPDRFFDAICCSALLVHISKHDVQKALSELARVAKQGARLYLVTKEGAAEGFVADPRYGGAEKYNVQFTLNELLQHLERAGFTSIESFIRPSRGYRDKNTIYLLTELKSGTGSK